MRVLIFSGLYAPEPSGVGPYSAGLAASLASSGATVAVIAANPSYPHWRLYDGFGTWRWSVAHEHGVTVHRCPVYVPQNPGGLARMLHYLSFALTSAFPAIRVARKMRPDVVIHVAPSLLSSPVVRLTAWVAGAKTSLHVQDFEVEAAFATGQLKAGGFVARCAFAFERWCLQGYDLATSISTEMCRKLIEKGSDPDKVYEFRNWADIDSIRPQSQSGYREAWAIKTAHVVLFSGSIARKQGIEIIVEAARQLADRTDLTFVVCGNGPYRAKLEKLAAGMSNIQFHDLQPKEALGDLLALATIHLMPQLADAADLVLPSKLTNMLASGRPVIATAAPGTSLAREVDGCGVITAPEDPGSFATAIAKLLDDPDQLRQFGTAARARAELVWDRSRIIEAYTARLQSLLPCRTSPSTIPLESET